jgi:hypothetical protein
MQQEGSGGGVIVLAPGPAARADAPDAVTEETIWERTALGRAALMAGAVSAVAAMTLRQ